MENKYKDKTSSVDEIMETQDRDIMLAIEKAAKDMEKTKRDYEVEVKSVEESWDTKCKGLEERKFNLEGRLDVSKEKLRQIKTEISTMRLEKEQLLQELEAKSRKDINKKIEITNKDLEAKVKIMEKDKSELERKIFELTEEIKHQETKHSIMTIRCKKENSELKQDLSNMQKDQSLKFAECVKLEQEIEIANTIIEVIYKNIIEK